MTWKDGRPEFDLELPQTETKHHTPEEVTIRADSQKRQYSLGGFIVGGIMALISLPALLLPFLTQQVPDSFWGGVGWMFTAIIMLWRSCCPMRWTQGVATLVGGMLVGWSVTLAFQELAAGAAVTAPLIVQFFILLIPAALLIKIGARSRQ